MVFLTGQQAEPWPHPSLSWEKHCNETELALQTMIATAREMPAQSLCYVNYTGFTRDEFSIFWIFSLWICLMKQIGYTKQDSKYTRCQSQQGSKGEEVQVFTKINLAHLVTVYHYISSLQTKIPGHCLLYILSLPLHTTYFRRRGDLLKIIQKFVLVWVWCAKNRHLSHFMHKEHATGLISHRTVVACISGVLILWQTSLIVP